MSVFSQWKAPGRPAFHGGSIPYKIFLSLVGLVNFALMMLVLGHALSSVAYWMPPMAVALVCWFDWKSLDLKRLRALVAVLSGLALMILTFQEAQYVLATALTWNQRSIADIKAFVRRTLPRGAVVYGPADGYFYPVEMAGDHYLYLYDQTRGPLSEPHASIAEKIEEEVCSRPTFAIWPEAYPPRQIWAPAPESVRVRIQTKVGEFHEPALSPWRDRLVRRIGAVGSKYGFPDVAIYRLKSLDLCKRK